MAHPNDFCPKHGRLYIQCPECLGELPPNPDAWKDRADELKDIIVSLLAWTYGGACSDCEMFRTAPSQIDFIHHKDCGHLETINKALILIGRDPQEGHDFDDPKAEMVRLHAERWAKCVERARVDPEFAKVMPRGWNDPEPEAK